MELPPLDLVSPLQGTSVAGNDFVIAEWTDGGESSSTRPIAPLHVHYGDDEAWYVLEGSLGFIRGDARLTAPAGAAVLVPRGVPHTYWNAGPGPARYLLVMPPRIAALIEALHRPGAHDNLPALFARFDAALLA